MSPAQPRQPSDLYAAFTYERLAVIARILFEERSWVAKDAKPDRGDKPVVIGFRAWHFATDRIAKLAKGHEHAWLSVGTQGPHFVIKFNMVPVRFCRGDSSSSLPENYRQPTPGELADLRLAFTAAELVQDDLYFRFLVSSDSAGHPIAVFLAAFNRHTLRREITWQVPLNGEAGGAAPIMVPKGPVDLPDWDLTTHEEEAERAAAEEERKRRDADGEDEVNVIGRGA